MDKDNRKKRNTVITVLGMHRSGTSALARALEVFGVPLGDNLHPAGFDNPKGFWEDREFLAINNELLDSLGSAYDCPGLLSRELAQESVIESLSLRATRYLKEKLNEFNGRWGFKDPRTARLLWFWLPIFDDCKCDVKIVIALRNPMSVALSLKKRNDIAAIKCYLLWLDHMIPIILQTQQLTRVLVNFDEFLSQPYKQLRRVALQLDLSLAGQNDDQVKWFVEQFLDEGLRHSKFDMGSLRHDDNMISDVMRAYEVLGKAAKDEVGLDDPEIVEKFKCFEDRYKSFQSVVNHILYLEQERNKYALALNGQTGITIQMGEQIKQLHNAVGERDRQIKQLHNAIGERDRQIEQFHNAVGERDRQIKQLHNAVGERDRQIAQLRHTLKEVKQSYTWRIANQIRKIRGYLAKIFSPKI